ncbi:MAG: hypothetical protein WC224_02160 [Sphaerochaetaceae bacterium]
MGERKNKLLIIINILALLALVVSFFLAKTPPLTNSESSGITTTFSRVFNTLEVRRFIWLLIYPLLFLFSIYQIAVRSRSDVDEDPIGRVGLWFVIAALAIGASLINLNIALLWPLLILLIALIIIYVRVQHKDASLGYRIGTIFPFSVFLGWVSIVAVNEITLYLYNTFASYIPFSESTLALITLSLIVLINLLAILIYGDIWFTLVGVWTLIEIYIKLSRQMNHDQDMNRITVAGVGLLVLSILIHLIIKGGKVARQENYY